MKRPDNATLEQRPEAFNCVRVNGSYNIFVLAVANHPGREMLVDVGCRRETAS